MSGAHRTIKIGTRGSPLALKQVEMVREALGKAFPALETEVVVIKTSGDWRPEDGEVRLRDEEGGKGQFAREIEEALLAGAVDCAVHSMKDMDSTLPAGLTIRHMLVREDPRDVLLFNPKIGNIRTIQDIPRGATIGTASVRRQAFLLQKRPDLNIVPLRGNVQTRIDKLNAGQVDVTLLALAGLKRLNISHEPGFILEREEMLPAAGQGAVGIEIRENDEDVLSIFSRILCENTAICVFAERAVLAALDGSCHTPVGAHAILKNGQLWLCAQLVSLDGTRSFFEEGRMPVSTPDEGALLGREVGRKLKDRIPPGILG